MRVLIVDDLEANRMLLQQQLAYLGFTQFMQAENGQHALNLMQETLPDLVITDCNMPVADGFQLAKAIRSTPALAHVLVVGCTADARPENRQRALAEGMNDCLIKPIGVQSLQQMLFAFKTPAGAAQVEPPLPSDDVNPPSQLLAALSRFVGGDSGQTRQLLLSLERSNREDGERLQAMLNSHDVEGVEQVIHKIRGMAQLIQATELISLSEELNGYISLHGDIPATEAFACWNSAFQTVKEGIEEALTGLTA